MPKLVKQIPLFPTAGSLHEATDIILSQLPITDSNKLHALLMMFQNTLIHEIEKAHAEQRANSSIQKSRN